LSATHTIAQNDERDRKNHCDCAEKIAQTRRAVASNRPNCLREFGCQMLAEQSARGKRIRIAAKKNRSHSTGYPHRSCGANRRG